jgi:hypothetical protein
MMGRRRNGFSPVIGMVIASGFFLMLGLTKATGALGAASIPIWGMAIAGVVFALKGPLGEALLRAVADNDRSEEMGGASPEVLHELDDLRAQVSELQERMDFTERMLAREREERPLAAGDRT